MGQSKTTIELNGKLYDASTGAMLHNEATIIKPQASSAVAVDGFFRRPTPVTHQPKVVTPQPTRQPATPKPKRSATTVTRKPEHAKTLMRHVVKKPHLQAPVVPVKHKEAAQPTHTTPEQAHHSRQARAAHIPKSSAISRFGSGAAAPVIDKKVQHLPVRPHPHAAIDAAPPIHKTVVKPAKESQETTSEAFNKALENAQSHQQAPLKHSKLRHRTARKLGISARALTIASTTLVVVLLTGFVAYQNVPNVSMRIAATRAGFNASLPGYTPAGFSMNGPIHSAPGAVTVSFRSNSDNRSFTVTQKVSDWTSESLRSNFFGAGDNPTAYQDKGKTIYLYNNGSSATWVNGGVLYQVSGNANLSSDQVVSIADSL